MACSTALELSIDLDAYGLEAPLGRMLFSAGRRRAWPPRITWASCPVVSNGAPLPAAAQWPPPLAAVPLFSVFPQDLAQLLPEVYVFTTSQAEKRLASVHPHIQRRVVHVRKATVSIVQLIRRNAQVEQNAVHAGQSPAFDHLGDLSKIAF